jgi:hypothetical protein
MNEATVYVIAGKMGGKLVAPSKVGMTAHPYGRLAALQTGSPVVLAVHAYIRLPTKQAAYTIERWFHEDNQERRLHGEWFNIDPMVAMKDLAYELRTYLRGEFPDNDAYEDMLDWCLTAVED